MIDFINNTATPIFEALLMATISALLITLIIAVIKDFKKIN